MRALPLFAIVGHPNKGKSSLVATLANNETVPIAAESGTTRHADRYPMTVLGETLYELVDTPGFQRARRVLAWLEQHAASAAERPEAVRRFVVENHTDPMFEAECALLAPISDGAGIIYVVDGAVPYGPEYEAEMEILRWSGRPSLAVINPIGARTYVSAWRDALGQYFKVVREVDVLAAGVEQRLDLLRAFGELDEAWKPTLKRAVQVLGDERDRAERRAAEIIAGMLADALTIRLAAPLAADADEANLRQRLEDDLRAALRRAELNARQEIERLYQHHGLERQEQALEFLEADLFESRTWALFGLDRLTLAGLGGTGGAAAGLGLDALVGGASLFAGAAIGAVAGSAAAWFAADQLAGFERDDLPFGEQQLTVSAGKSRNLPFVLLGRARLHHRLVSRRSHAERGTLVLDSEANPVGELESEERSQLGRIFAKLGELSADAPQSLLDELRGSVAALIKPAKPE
ncbi:MAG: DUF3482 domain-containing protein [Pseudomonadota bacterium]